MKRIHRVIVVSAVWLIGGCDQLTVPDLNNPGLESLLNNPTRTAVNTAATGLIIGVRVDMGDQNGYVSMLGILGRESYNLDPADPRFITEMLIGPLQPGSPAFGGNHFAERYTNIRNANVLLGAVDKVPDLDLNPAQKSGIKGFAKTIQAYDFLRVINTRDANGAPLDVDISTAAPPAPIATKQEVFARIVQLLDGGATDLRAAGSAFSFPLGTGFTGFDTPAGFLKVNRALRARVAVYLGDFAGALTALQASFLDLAQPLTLGAYHTYSTGSGDTQNALFDPTARAINAHPSIVTDAQRRADGSLDLRVQQKIVNRQAITVQGVTTDKTFRIYNSPDAPIPIIRNEELILLRAEANIGLGNLGAALADIDLIRVRSGGLPPYAGPMTQAALLDELLYEKRYSLLFEGGHRWIDARRYNRLNLLPRDLPAHRVAIKYPFPVGECDARTPQPSPGCQPEVGLP